MELVGGGCPIGGRGGGGGGGGGYTNPRGCTPRSGAEGGGEAERHARPRSAEDPGEAMVEKKAAALRGVAIQRGRVGAARAAFPTGAAALALARNPGPLAAAAAATALHPFAPTVYYDPFLAAHAATQDPNYRLQAAAAAAAASPLLKTPLSTAQQATYAAAASYTAVAARAYSAAAAAAQPVAGYAAVTGYGREYADPYLGHGIGPVAGYGVMCGRGRTIRHGG
ncbi:hypothetical protein KM043_015671 [Ampulex compressa]|nr:hypothetical protein KM043_015671 [Ampulex compressa]